MYAKIGSGTKSGSRPIPGYCAINASRFASVPNPLVINLQVVAAGDVLTRGSFKNSVTRAAGTDADSKRPARNSSNNCSDPEINLNC